MSDQPDNQTSEQETEPNFLEAFNITYSPITNKLSTSFGQVDSTGKQFRGDLVVKAAHAKMRNLRQEVINNARGRILLIDGGATLAATQVIIGSVFNVVSAIAIRDPKLATEESKQAYLVTLVISTDRFSVGDVLHIDATD